MSQFKKIHKNMADRGYFNASVYVGYVRIKAIKSDDHLFCYTHTKDMELYLIKLLVHTSGV